jgi:type IV secretion system protein VirB9
MPGVETPTPAEKVYAFARGVTFDVPVQVGVPLDLILEHGEKVRNLVGGHGGPPAVEPGQTAPASPWTVQEGLAGEEATLRPHVFATATTPGLTLALVITSTARVYYITLKSVKVSPVRVVRWTYTDVEVKPPLTKEPGLLPAPREPRLYHIGYDVVSAQEHRPDWTPRQVLDDGKKMYLVLPEVTLFATAPMVRMIGPNGAALVNVRQFLNVIIVDQLAPRLELRVGIGETAEVVTITRGQLRTIACGGNVSDADCPVWPHAASLLARRAQP